MQRQQVPVRKHNTKLSKQRVSCHFKTEKKIHTVLKRMAAKERKSMGLLLNEIIESYLDERE